MNNDEIEFNQMISKDGEFYKGEFYIYIIVEFNHKLDQATIKDFAEWTFGDVETALESFRESRAHQ